MSVLECLSIVSGVPIAKAQILQSSKLNELLYVRYLQTESPTSKSLMKQGHLEAHLAELCSFELYM
jgi:hypothetical protein